MREPNPSSEAAHLSLKHLRANEDFQPRLDGLDERHVALLMSSDPDNWPPLLVTPNGAGVYDVIDGFHRLEAARRLGRTALPCVVDDQAGYPEGVAANLRHGLPLRLSDRKAYARWLHELEPQLSLRELGRRCGLNHQTVRSALSPADDSTNAGGQNGHASATPILPHVVRQVVRAYEQGEGRTWFGLGRASDPQVIADAIATYPDDRQAAAAKALATFGEACLTAAGAYLDGDRR
jgi:hypothetical protein